MDLDSDTGSHLSSSPCEQENGGDTVKPKRQRDKGGRFVPGNKVGERKRYSMLPTAHGIVKLVELDKVDKRLRPHMSDLKKHVADLLSNCPADSLSEIAPIAASLGVSTMFVRYLLAQAATGDLAAVKELRSWISLERTQTATFQAMMTRAIHPDETTDNESPLLMLASDPDTERVSQRNDPTAPLKGEIEEAEFRSDADSEPGGEGGG